MPISFANRVPRLREISMMNKRKLWDARGHHTQGLSVPKTMAKTDSGESDIA